MPVSLDYRWEETPSEVHIKVPLRPGLEKNLHIVSTDVLVKVNCPPYLLLLDLHDSVDDVKSTAVVRNNTLHFTLLKNEVKLWGQLTATGDRKALQERREASIRAKEEQESKAREEMKEQRAKEERWAFDKSWQLEKEQRAKIEQKKEEEKAAYERALGLGGKASAARPAPALPARPAPAPAAPAPAPAAAGAGGAVVDVDEEEGEASEVPPLEDAGVEAVRPPLRDIFTDGDLDDEAAPPPLVSEAPPPPPPARKAPAVPAVRRGGTVTTSFTKLDAAPNVPARESVMEREAEERKKAAAHAKKAADARDASEENPVWLKDRGDAFFKGRDYRSAVSAYTAALELDAGLVVARANRAACHVLLEDWPACVADCTAAIAALAPAAPDGRLPPAEALEEAARRQVVKLLARRGAARWSLGEADAAGADYEAALRLEPGNEQIAADLHALRHGPAPAPAAAPAPPPAAAGGEAAGGEEAGREAEAGAERLKARGDAMLGERGDVEGAIEAYTAALRLRPGHPPLLANRAAAYLRAGRANECVRDASLLLAGLRAAAAPAPAALVRALVRRGSAYALLERLADACGDYEEALALDPSNEELAEDLARLRARLAGAPTPGGPPAASLGA